MIVVAPPAISTSFSLSFSDSFQPFSRLLSLQQIINWLGRPYLHQITSKVLKNHRQTDPYEVLFAYQFLPVFHIELIWNLLRIKCIHILLGSTILCQTRANTFYCCTCRSQSCPNPQTWESRQSWIVGASIAPQKSFYCRIEHSSAHFSECVCLKATKEWLLVVAVESSAEFGMDLRKWPHQRACTPNLSTQSCAITNQSHLPAPKFLPSLPQSNLFLFLYHLLGRSHLNLVHFWEQLRTFWAIKRHGCRFLLSIHP